MRKMFKVVTKAAIFNYDKTKVLVIYMDQNNDYGLPGGHIEEDESIDVAMKRELYEECGIKSIELTKVDFFTHSNGKIVLAYTGVLAQDERVVSMQDNLEGAPKWLSKDEFADITIEPNYRHLVLDNWK
jgi:8-oxo-dGTP pyrophosphatase MutT (NUDIX family)